MKPLLNYKSGHTKLVKNAIALSCFTSALKKTCTHLVESSFSAQVKKLRQAGFPRDVLIKVCEKLIKKIKRGPGDGCDLVEKAQHKKFAVLPYVHGFTHRLKKVASRYDVQVVISARNKLSTLCAKVDRRIANHQNVRQGTCNVSHVNNYVSCITGVVYSIPLTCKRVYVGQTGRCLNVRLREHFNSLNDHSGLHLAAHCKKCGCTPLFGDTSVLFRHKNQRARELIEAAHIHKNSESCVSVPSVAIHDKELSYLGFV